LYQPNRRCRGEGNRRNCAAAKITILEMRRFFVGDALASSRVVTRMFSQVFIHLLAWDNNQMGVFVVVADLTSVYGGRFGQKKKYQAAGENNHTNNSMAREAKNIHTM
jgi:hypothetical protein